MFSRIFIAALVLFSAEIAMAGAGNAQVTCKSASGRTLLSASVPVDFEASVVSITVDGKTQTYLDQGSVDDMKLNNEDPQKLYPGYQLVSIKTVTEKNAFSIVAYIDTGKRFDENFLALTSTGPLKKIKARGEKFQFNANLSGADPRSGNQTALPPKIQVRCIYDYHV